MDLAELGIVYVSEGADAAIAKQQEYLDISVAVIQTEEERVKAAGKVASATEALSAQITRSIISYQGAQSAQYEFAAIAMGVNDQLSKQIELLKQNEEIKQYLIKANADYVAAARDERGALLDLAKEIENTNKVRAKEAADSEAARQKELASRNAYYNEITTKAKAAEQAITDARHKAILDQQDTTTRAAAMYTKDEQDRVKAAEKSAVEIAAVNQKATLTATQEAERKAMSEISWANKSRDEQIRIKGQIAAYQTAGVGPATVANTFGPAAVTGTVKEVDNLAEKWDKVTLNTSRARTEMVVLAHEAIQGRFSRIPASMMVFAEYSDLTAFALSGVGLAIMSVVAAGVLMSVGMAKGTLEQEAMQNALITTGNYAGITADQLNAMGHSAAASGGSLTDAKRIVMELAASGKYTSEQIGTVSSAVIEMGHATHMSEQQLDGLVKQFASLQVQAAEHARYSDNISKALLKLDDQYHFLTTSVLMQVEALEREGKQKEASKLATDEFAKATKDRAEEIIADLGRVERGWNAIKEAIVRAKSGVGDWGKKDTLASEVAFLTAKKAELEGPTGTMPGGDNDAKLLEQIAAVTLRLNDAKKLLNLENAKALAQGAQAQAQSKANHALSLMEADAIKLKADRIGELATRTEQANQRLADIKADPTATAEVIAKAEQMTQDNILALQKKYADKKVAGTDTRAKELADALIVEKTALDGEKALYDDSTKMLDLYHSKLGMSDAAFYAGREVVRNEYLTALTSSYLKEAKLINDSVTKTPVEAANKQKQLDALYQQYSKTYDKIAELRTVDSVSQLADAEKLYNGIVKAVDKAGAKELEALEKAIAAQKLHNNEIGKTPAQIELVKAAMNDQLMVQYQIEAEQLNEIVQAKEVAPEWIAIYAKRRDDLLAIVAAQKELTAEHQKGSVLDADFAAVKKINQEWKKGWEETDRIAKSAFMGWAVSGQSMAEQIGTALRKSIANAIYDNFMRPYVLQIFASIIGGASGGAGSALGTASNAASIYNMGTGAYSAYGAAGSAYGGFASGWGEATQGAAFMGPPSSAAGGIYGNSASLGSSLANLTGASNAAAEGAAALSAEMGVATEATGSMGSAVIGSLGYVALFAGLYMLLTQSHGIPTQSTGSASSQYDQYGNRTNHSIGTIDTTTSDVYGTTGQGQDIGQGDLISAGGTTRIVNPANDKMVAAMEASYLLAAHSLGIAAAAAGFSYGGNTGKDSQNPNFAIDGGVIGGTQFSTGGETPLTDASLQDAASRAVFTALQGSTLPKYLAGVFDGMDASAKAADGTYKISGQQITNVEALAASYADLHAQLQSLPFASLKDLSYESAKGLVAASGGMQQLGASLGNYYTKFYSATEQTAILTKNTGDAFINLGEVMPPLTEAGRVQYRAMVDAAAATVQQNDALGLVNTADSLHYTGLLNLATAYDTLNPAIASTVASLADLKKSGVSLQDQYDKLTMSEADYRTKSITGMGDAQIAQYDLNIQTQDNITEFNRLTASMKGLGDTSAELAVQLLTAQGDIAGANAAQRTIDIKGMTPGEVKAYDDNAVTQSRIDIINATNAFDRALLVASGDTSGLAKFDKTVADAALIAAHWSKEQINAVHDAEAKTANDKVTSDYNRAMLVASGDTSGLAKFDQALSDAALRLAGWSPDQIKNVHTATATATAAAFVEKYTPTTAEQKVTNAQAHIDKVLKDLGLNIGGTAAQIATYVATIDPASTAGQNLINMLVALAPALDIVASKTAKVINSISVGEQIDAGIAAVDKMMAQASESIHDLAKGDYGKELADTIAYMQERIYKANVALDAMHREGRGNSILDYEIIFSDQKLTQIKKDYESYLALEASNPGHGQALLELQHWYEQQQMLVIGNATALLLIDANYAAKRLAILSGANTTNADLQGQIDVIEKTRTQKQVDRAKTMADIMSKLGTSTDQTTIALQNQLWALQDIEAVRTAYANVQSTLMSVADAMRTLQADQISAQQKVNNLTKSAADNLYKFAGTISDFLNTIDPASSHSLAYLQAQLSTTAVLAAGGDTGAQGKVIGQAQAFLDVAKANSTSALEYARSEAFVRRTLEPIQESATTQAADLLATLTTTMDKAGINIAHSLGLTGDAATKMAGLLAKPGTASSTLAILLAKPGTASTTLAIALGLSETKAKDLTDKFGTASTAALLLTGDFGKSGTELAAAWKILDKANADYAAGLAAIGELILPPIQTNLDKLQIALTAYDTANTELATAVAATGLALDGPDGLAAKLGLAGGAAAAFIAAVGTAQAGGTHTVVVPPTDLTPDSAHTATGLRVLAAYDAIDRAGFTSGGTDVSKIDVAGFNYWVDQLNSGAIAIKDFQNTFLTSAASYQGPNDAAYASREAIAAALLASGVKLPGFASGINYVPYDMTANIHAGEEITPRAYVDIESAARKETNLLIARLVASNERLETKFASIQASSDKTANASEHTKQTIDQVVFGGFSLQTRAAEVTV